ncbi:MAG: trypsin-like serine protease [Anaerolineae bacterium]|nr:trypsin-like serine protease [Anaerolineae bacterium]
MRRKLAIIAALVAITLLVVPSVSAITFGQPDNGEHPYVGTLLFVQNGAGYYSCSGTLISPTVMLTAGHCVEEAGNVNDVTYVRFDEDAMAGYAEAKNTDQWLKKNWIQAKTVIPHPMYDDFSQFPATYDVGLVILAKPVHLGTYGQLPSQGFLETITPQTNSFTAVGYGMQGYVPAFYADVYARYKGTVSLVELNSNSAGGHSAKFTNNPGGGNGSGGTCFGDSGGPVFYQNSNIVTAVVSWGITPCIGVDYQFRVDTAIALDFIHQYVP